MILTSKDPRQRLPEDILSRLESTILDRKKKYIDKINVLLASWEQVPTYLICASFEVIDKLIRIIYRYTLHLILKADWKHVSKASKTHLMVTVTRCHRELDMKKNPYGLCTALCVNLINIINDPWDVKVLTDIIHGNQPINQEAQKYFTYENGVLVVMRIEALVDSKCEDFALRLADSCQQFLRTEKTNKSNNNTSQEERKELILETYQLDLIMDLYLTLLFRCEKNCELKSIFQDYDLTEGVHLLQRFRDRKCGFGFNKKLWKNYKMTVEVGCCVFLTKAFLQPIEEIENCSLLEALIKEWLTFQTGSQLEDVIRKLVYSARSSQHIYTFCEVLIKHFGLKLKSFCIELFIIALTVNMNEIETHRDKNDTEKVREKEVQLARGFLILADLLQDDMGVCRECVLTAFSLNPTESILERIKSLAVATGKCTPADDASDQLQGSMSIQQQSPNCTDYHPNGSSLINKQCSVSSSMDGCFSDSITITEQTHDALIRIKEEASTESPNYVLSSLSSVLNAESLGLSNVLCNDLATIISSPRYQMLSWVLDWPRLLAICESYLKSGCQMKNQTKELKFLNIDYNIFKDWPKVVDRDMYCDIEKGYEQCIEPNYYFVHTKITKNTNSETAETFTNKTKKKRQRPRKDPTYVTRESKRKRKPINTSFKYMYLDMSDTDTGTEDCFSNSNSSESDVFQSQLEKINLKSARNCKSKAKDINYQKPINDESIVSVMPNSGESQTSFINKPNNLSPLGKTSDTGYSVLEMLRMFRRAPKQTTANPGAN
ncbi:uncharacterized protein LOC111048503 [Nilaparvata lugens]|uniref:uncharacterized protein LOC111048503 n=1 Tax=Nilaparvata lugens TaxID=108931 RepID=UPI00193D18FA|nr:uncharacterized protein LOC111048503 [Nilaparvata lugens]XP_022190092.2 uncharacterized protein LOC111048503 [Nilaparvata lugens]XP_022190093.2 uncharacterized protein LOC111048503 [Nilaparvata lugens]